MFIAIEGIDGSGKSTQAKMLADSLKAKGKNILLTREPGGTEFAENIREVLLRGHGIKDPMIETLLLNAARRDHILSLQSTLAAKAVVICDRFLGSTLAYQGALKGLLYDKILQLHNIAIDGFLPDLTIIVDIEITTAKARLESRHNKDGQKSYYDDMQDIERKKLLEFYKQLPKLLHPSKSIVINGNQDVLLVHDDILKALSAIL